ncbi:MAG TPA: chemotaxis protein CheW [Spirochaetota bacterium]|nr:chemotaxis protein CheW [Spirochaetota bacterium]
MEETTATAEQQFLDETGDGADAQADKYMLFKIADEVYGIGIKSITEIIELQKITHVPDMPDYIKGVINLRGKVIPVMDIRLRFGMPERDYDDRTCIIIVNINDTSIGFLVDTVAEVHDIPEKNIEPAPDFKDNQARNNYIAGLGKVGEEVKILLDAEKMLYSHELEQIKRAAGKN